MSSQHVIVTGASSGIGRAAALRFGRAGAAVLATGRDEEELAAAAKDIVAAGGRAEVLRADITDPEAPELIVRTALDRWSTLTTVVNAAGVITTGSIESTTDEQWDAMMDINLRAPFRLMRAAAPHLPAGTGSIVNVSSVNGQRSFANVLAYCVSKAGLDHLTRCAALELAPRGIRVNAVNPGVTVSNLHRRSGMTEENYAAFLVRSRETHPIGRPGEPAEIAELIFYLASGAAGWITGETICIDGGRHLTCAR